MLGNKQKYDEDDDENDINKTFNFNEVKTFLKLIKQHKYECFFKLIMTYELSRVELVSLEWKDIDFDNDLINIYPISSKRNNKFYYNWSIEKLKDFKRTFPLLPNVKKLLLEERYKQLMNCNTNEKYNVLNQNFVCLKQDGTRLNFNTLSRNLRAIGRDYDLPQIFLSGLKKSLDEFICRYAGDYDFYRAWTRFDCAFKSPRHIYDNFNLFKNKFFLNAINSLLESSEQTKKSKDMEM